MRTAERNRSQRRRVTRPWFLTHLALAFIFVTPASADSAETPTVRVGVYDNPPKIFYSKGHIAGIFGGLIAHIAAKAHWNIKPVPCEWKQCLALLESGKIDLMPDVAINSQRQAVMNFGQVPALYSWSALYRNKNAAITSIRDIQGKRIAVLAGSIQQAYLRNLIDRFGIRDTRLVAVTSLNTGFEQASKGLVAAAVANNFFGDSWASQYDLKSTPVLFQPAKLYFVAPRGRNLTLLAAIDHDLGQWQSDSNSIYYKIIQNWTLPANKRALPRELWWGLGALAALFLAAVIIVLVQRRMMKDKVRRLRSSESRLATILDSIDAFIDIKDPELNYAYANRKVANFLKRPPEQIVGLRDDAFFDTEIANERLRRDQGIIESGEAETFEEERRDANGQIERAYLTVKQPLRDDLGRIYGLCSISTDFTEHRRNQERVNQLAFYDPLTNLPNRRLLLDRAAHALQQFRRTASDGALLFIDLDNFKVLNDSRGHAQGDRLLAQVADRLSHLIRDSDTLARLGGDEFVLLLENLGTDSVETRLRTEIMAHKLLGTFDEPHRLDRFSYKIGASIGIALFSHGADHVDELLKRADMAMYEAKMSGRNRFRFYSEQMQSALDLRALVELDMLDSIQHQDFFLDYQPQVNSDGRVIGAEALVRWQHPKKGRLSPMDFIPIAEMTGHIMQLGEWVLRQACLQQVLWREQAGLERLVVAVNISTRQLCDPEFVNTVSHIIEETGADPQCLELELTESILAKDVPTTISHMKTLKEVGLRFSLDDFGTGYSSLGYLKRLPLDQLKIDQIFVHDLLTDPSDATIVASILSLGRSLDLSVIAEGVETAQQREALIAMGCTRHQGYLYGRPGPASQMAPHCQAERST